MESLHSVLLQYIQSEDDFLGQASETSFLAYAEQRNNSSSTVWKLAAEE